MNQEVLNQPVLISNEAENKSGSTWRSYIPFAFAIIGSIAVLLLRINLGGASFISDGALMMLALAAYLIAAVFYLTNLYAPSDYAEKLGMWGAGLGVFFNLSAWLVRWVSAFDRELAIFTEQGKNLAEMPWVFRYVPFANLYDLSLAFAFGAGITTLLVIRRPQFRFVATIALPLAAIILVLARFIGSEFIDLPPVLDSYWRPIHVGIASLSYGIALVCFAVGSLFVKRRFESSGDGNLDEYFRARGFRDDRQIQRFFFCKFRNLYGFDLSRQFAVVARLAGGHSVCRLAHCHGGGFVDRGVRGLRRLFE